MKTIDHRVPTTQQVAHGFFPTQYIYRPRTEYDGRLCFYRCLSVNRGRGTPAKSRRGGGGGTPRYLPPGQVQMGGGVPQGTYPTAKVPTPPARFRWVGGNPRYLPPWPRYLLPIQVQMWREGTRYLPPPAKVPTPKPGPYEGEGVPQGTYPPPRPRYLPSPQDRTAYGVLDTPRSVCLLRSRKNNRQGQYLNTCRPAKNRTLSLCVDLD